MKKKRLSSLTALPAILLLLLSIQGKAQDSFAYVAPLDTVGQAAFYKIILSPQIVGKCREDLADLRILGPEKQYVPYVLRSDLPLSSAEGFSEFPIISPRTSADTSSDVQIANWSSGPIKSLLLFIRNISVRRNCTLSGSDDREKWFVIKEHIPLEAENADSTDYYIQRINFPASNYHYFKIIQEEKSGLPVNILRAGIATRHFTNGRYQHIPDASLSQKDSSDHHTYIILSYAAPFLTDRLELDIQGPTFYKRAARIYDKEHPYSVVNIIIDPNHHVFQVPSVKARVLVIDITNDDNPPLIIKKAATSQLERYLLAWLQPGNLYKLLLGDARTTAAQYDLSYFVDSLSQEPASIIPGALQVVTKPPAPVVGKDHSGILLWGIIFVVLALLITLCVKMLKAIPESSEKNDRI